MENLVITSATVHPGHFKTYRPARVTVKTEDGEIHELFEFYPDEISFTSSEFIGLTIKEARSLKFKKDKEYLQS